MPFHLPHIDSISFWIGFATATVFWWLINAMRPLFQQMRQSAREKREATRAHSTSNVEEHYRKVILQRAQGMHLAAPLFSLDEIIEIPLLLAPPARVEPGSPLNPEDIVALCVPYTPTWPELAATYQAPVLTLPQVFSCGVDLVFTGQPGCGKTVALAYLASLLARREITDSTDDLPILIHVADLDLPAKDGSAPLAPMTEFLAEKMPASDLPRLPDLLNRAAREGRAVLLLDGLDELTNEGARNVVAYLKVLKETFPKMRFVTTAQPECLNGLVDMQFFVFTIAAWDRGKRIQFINRWGDLWSRYVSIETWVQMGPEQIDPILINHWLYDQDLCPTPLELTLHVWGMYAGDIRGDRALAAIDTHLRRLKPPDLPFEALELLALQVNLAAEPIFDPKKAREWIKSFEPRELETPEQVKPEKKKRNRHEKVAATPGLLQRMVESGLLVQHRNNRLRFLHPVFSGYLAGKALLNYKPDSILEQAAWCGKFLTMQYYAAHGDATHLVNLLLASRDKPLERNLLTAARWLRDAPGDMPWRGLVMEQLTELLRTEGLPVSLRGQALAALVLSKDPGTAALFRELRNTSSVELLQLCALGSGAIQDTKAIDELNPLLNSPYPNVRRAICLAMVAIGSTAALEAVGTALLHGDEDLRRSAAEALANNPGEGHAMLRDGSTMEDILVRRAVVYGLGRINQPWAEEILARLQVEDDQWIVRNAANAVVEGKQTPDSRLPRPLTPPSETPWLLEFAGKQGMGISPGQPVTDLLLQVLKIGSEDERLAVLIYLKSKPGEGVFSSLYHAMYSGNPGLREATFQTLCEMAAAGISLPNPQQFGVG